MCEPVSFRSNIILYIYLMSIVKIEITFVGTQREIYIYIFGWISLKGRERERASYRPTNKYKEEVQKANRI